MLRRFFIATILAGAFVASTASPAFAIHRSEVISRGKAWLYDHVPYSQSEYHEGYRTDCSGFASMVWRLKYGDGSPESLSTRTLYQVCTVVPTSALLPGDAECDPGHHIFIFLRWNDAAHTQMVTLEESGSQTGTTSRIRTVANLGGYRPYRFRGIEPDPPWGSRLEFIEGANRFETAAIASQRAFRTGAPVVVIGSSAAWPDVLAASGLAGSLGGPILLVEHSSMPRVTMLEIKRLGARTAVIAGGPGSVDPHIAQVLSDAGLTVQRVAGAEAAATAASMASRTLTALKASSRSWDKTVFLAASDDWPDALAAGPLAARKGWPLLFTEGSTLSTVTSDALTSLRATKVIVLGGTGAISESVVTRLKAKGLLVERLAGADRYATALAIAHKAETSGMVWSGIAIASGTSNSDAMIMGPIQARSNTFLLLSPGRGGLYAGAARAVAANARWIRWARTVGGDGVINYEVRHGLYDAVGAK